jgi:uncharacterized membrane protein YoaT (DUF817 family)
LHFARHFNPFPFFTTLDSSKWRVRTVNFICFCLWQLKTSIPRHITLYTNLILLSFALSWLYYKRKSLPRKMKLQLTIVYFITFWIYLSEKLVCFH